MRLKKHYRLLIEGADYQSFYREREAGEVQRVGFAEQCALQLPFRKRPLSEKLAWAGLVGLQ